MAETELKPQENMNECYFCGAEFLRDKFDDYTEEVGEFWSDKLQDSVLAHPDCTPRGVEAILMGEDPDWKLA